MRTILFLLALTGLLPVAHGQGNRPSATPNFYAEANPTELRMGRSLSVSFHLENIQGGNFRMPDWQAAGFELLGSSQASSISIVDGSTNISATYNFTISPRKSGRLEIPPVTIRSEGKEYRTEALVIQVVPDPHGDPEETPSSVAPRKTPAKPEAPKKKIPTTRI